MSGLPCRGCVMVKPLFILNRRLKATLSSLPFVPDRGSHFAWSVQGAMKRLAVSAGLLHADFRCNVSFSESDPKRRRLSLLGVGRDNDGRQCREENQTRQRNDTTHGHFLQ